MITFLAQLTADGLKKRYKNQLLKNVEEGKISNRPSKSA
jgi:hypothetical protein